jgi:hypothetical protein
MLVKAPGDVLDFEWDWGTDGWLPQGDTIATVDWTAESGITVETNPAPSNTSTTATVWIGGGTAGQTYTLTCQITTAAGRVGQWTQDLSIENL